jgi:NAD(P)-dependent dehydrogenase (short-subunit alcohol dehydrogenase family)
MDIPSLFNVSAKTVIVTGGSGGIGRAIATGFCDNGARVFICSRKGAACAQTAQELQSSPAAQASGGSCTGIAADLSTVAAIDAFIATLRAPPHHVTKVDVLVNNAGW